MMSFLPPIVTVFTLLLGHPVTVTCAANGYEGTVLSDTAVQISPFMCHEYAAPIDDPLDRQAAAAGLLVAIHEAEHIRYHDADEVRTECRALRDYVAVLGGLHVPRRWWGSMLVAAVSADGFFFGLRQVGCTT